MVATRSQQDQASALSTQQYIASDDTKLPIRAVSSKKRTRDPETTTVASQSDLKRQKVEDLPHTDEHDTSATFAAVVIPTSQPETTDEIEEKTSSRERTSTDGIEFGAQRLREHTGPHAPAGNEKIAIQDGSTIAADPKSMGSSKRKVKKSHLKDPRMDLMSHVNTDHRTRPAGSKIKSSSPRLSSIHKRFDDEEAQSIPPVPHTKSSFSQVSNPSEIDDDAQEASSGNEAPEVVTQATGLEQARFTAAEAARAIEAQRATGKQKRQERDKLLKTQAKAPKQQPKDVDLLDVEAKTLADDDTPDQIPPSPLASSDQIDWSDKRPLPDLLPEDILAAEPPTRLSTPPSRDDLVKVSVNKKRRFLETSTKPAKDIKKGGVRIRVLDDTKSLLPPKVAKSSRLIRESWLNGRKGSKGKMVMERRKVGAGFIRR
ncbi:MAG: hypothetical protein LQ352_003658 [Teloschistes flavicans]|nr:MAG: hypothetical protein LQ352_003658 [Teloschistes flavicans]